MKNKETSIGSKPKQAQTSTKKNLFQLLSGYAKPNRRKASWQLINSFGPYLFLWILLIIFIKQEYPFWSIVPLLILAAGFMVRIFIIFHDCAHGSFFRSKRATLIWGYIAGILTFTAYRSWRRSHLGHHASYANLDNRGIGDIWVMTVEEYLMAPFYKKIAYRLYRHPLTMLLFGPFLVFLIINRLPNSATQKRDHLSLQITNFAILGILIISSFTMGLYTYLMIQLPVLFLAGTAGVWLFYVQHQFEGVYWARHEDWDPQIAALQGSSYYKLPRIIQWFSGNIGFHHIHHINPFIPNYNLQQCQNEVEFVKKVNPLTLRRSLKSMWLHLWNEKNKKLVSFRSLKSTAKTR